MDQALLSQKLEEMARKYSIASQTQVGFEPGAVTVRWDGGHCRFTYDFAQEPKQDGLENVPLLHWRQKRRYRELCNILSQELVKTPLAMRIHHIVPKDGFTRSLTDVLFMEADLAQWICGQEIDRVFASMDGSYLNGIFSTTGGIKVSAELGIVADGCEPVLLHEVIGKTGILSDVAVDTQTRQYPIYVFKGPETQVYDDIDDELYGLSQTECDAVRFILWALGGPERREQARQSAGRNQAVVAAVRKAAQSVAYTPVQGGPLA